MTTEEIEIYLNEIVEEMKTNISLEKLYEIFIELTIRKSEIHKLIHFCIDDYERKNYFSMLELANSLQYVCNKKINTTINERSKNLEYDFKIEKEHIASTLKDFTKTSVLFQEFCQKILPKKSYSQLELLAQHCKIGNMKVAEYLKQGKYKEIDFDNED